MTMRTDSKSVFDDLLRRQITEDEYRLALALGRLGSTLPEDSAAYWQLCRCYRGQVFDADEAARALRLLRARPRS